MLLFCLYFYVIISNIYLSIVFYTTLNFIYYFYTLLFHTYYYLSHLIISYMLFIISHKKIYVSDNF